MCQPVLFGEKEPLVEYRERTGAYGLVEAEGGKTAAVRIPTGLFLIGGGIEPGEDREKALAREFLEETGFSVRVGDYLGCAQEYLFSRYFGRHMFVTGHFFRVTLLEKAAQPVETDHELIWLGRQECARSLVYRYQRWGAERAFGLEPGF